MKDQSKWILLMDGQKAKVLRKDDSDTYKHIYGEEHLEEFSHEKTEKLKKIDKELFTRKLANFLNQNVDLYDKIVLVAPDHILGYLRTFLHKDVRRKIYKEVHSDLMNVPLNELDSNLNE